ncbi:MAG: nucleotidyltransferase domain-containing protein [Candidatus Hydrogenedentes bacterium]|nr:nucleotidyltransferase domain-containing protein [Candidatus Hydrogenedentota bacterium]
MNPSLDLTAAQHEQITALLTHHLPGVEVWAFGSRVKHTARPNSDLDLVAFAEADHASRVADLREAFEDSALPFRVDLHVWRDLPESFQRNIAAEYTVLQHGR